MAPGLALGGRGRPACCGAVENFVAAKMKEAHKRKVSGARSAINNDWSVREDTRLEPSRRNRKNEQLQDDKFANIERENVRLLLRMQEIGGRAAERRPAARPDLGDAGKAAARIVLGMPPQAQGPTRSIARCSSLPAMGKGSNENGRMRELRRIDDENRKMLKRLQGAKPTMKVKRLEEQHRSQQQVMHMRRESGPKMPGSRLPLPFSVAPAEVEDMENERIENLHAQLLSRVQELEQQENEGHSEDGVSRPPSVHSENSATLRLAEEPSAEEEERREFVGGQMPEHSRLLVEQLMKEMEERERPASLSPDEEALDDDNGKNAVANMLAAADALDTQDGLTGGADYLSYDNVVQRSRDCLEAARAGRKERGLR